MDLLSAIEEHTDNLDSIERDDTYELGDKLARSFPKHKKPTISYKFLNIKIAPKYCFNHEDIGKTDFEIYFQKIKEICSTSYDDLINTSNRKLDFTIYSSPNKELWKQFKIVVGDETLTPEQKPSFGRIGLYNSEKGKKAPRIFFFVGHNCTLHIFLFDTYHQIYSKE